MKVLKSVFDFYINSSIHVGLAIVCLTAVTCLHFQIPLEFTLLSFIFLASVTAYNFIKYAGIAKLHHFSLSPNIRLIQVFSFIVFLLLLYVSFYQKISVLILSGVMAIFTVLYALPVFNEQKNLRAVPGIKIYVIAFVVSAVTVLMPLINNYFIVGRDVLLEFIQRFFIVIVLILPFEIRDLKYDMAQLGTIPQVIGVSRTKMLGYILSGFFVLPEFLKETNRIASVLGIIVLAVIAVAVVKNSSVRQGKYYASFWVEAVPILWFLVVLFLSEII